MKIIYNFIVIFILILQSTIHLQAQNTGGREFWITFGKIQNYTEAISSMCHQIRIVSGSKPASGHIYFTELGTSESFAINANEVFTYTLNLAQKAAIYNSTLGVSNRSIHIISYNEPVTVYTFASHPHTHMDATNVLPMTALGTEYYQISYKDCVSPPNHTWDAYAVIATQNNTQVYHNGTPAATLNKGQVYYRSIDADMTGTHITSNNPVAFYSLHQGASVPIQGHYSILLQQFPHVSTWDRTFFVPITNFNKDIIRCVATKNNTNITLTGGIIRIGVPGAQNSLNNLQSGQFVELDFTSDYTGCLIESNNPIGVCSYISNYQYTGLFSNSALCWIPGVKQTISQALIAPFVPQFQHPFLEHFAIITTPTISKNNTMVSIGGATPLNLSSENWKDNIATGMSFCSIKLTDFNKSYLFTNPAGFLIFCYCGGTGETYYYPAYSAMRDLQATFSANDIPYQLLKENDFCEGGVHFLAEIDGLHPTHPERITWWIDGVEYLPAKTLDNWNKYFSAGTYEIRMDVIFDNNETASKTGTLIIKSCNQSAAFFANNVLHSELKDTTFCNKNVNFRAEIEGLHPTASDSIMWYINNVFETSQATWNKTFENGTYEIKLVVRYDNDTYATLTGTLKIQALWIKIRNVRY